MFVSFPCLLLLSSGVVRGISLFAKVIVCVCSMSDYIPLEFVRCHFVCELVVLKIFASDTLGVGVTVNDSVFISLCLSIILLHMHVFLLLQRLKNRISACVISI